MSVVQFVIGVNCAIALFGFFVAWRIWQIKRALTQATIALTAWEQTVHRALNPDLLPPYLLQGQHATAELRDRYARLHAQLQQLNRIFSLARIAFKVLPLPHRRLRPRRAARRGR